MLEVVSAGGATAGEETSQEPFTSETTESVEGNIKVVLLDYVEEQQDNSKDEENLNEEEVGYLVISESEDMDNGSGNDEEHNKELVEDGLNSEAMKICSGSGDESENEEHKDGDGMEEEASDRDIVKNEPISVVIEEKGVAPKELDTPNQGPIGPKFKPNKRTSPSFSSSSSSSCLHQFLCGVVIVSLAIN